jgi:hypothetical protein
MRGRRSLRYKGQLEVVDDAVHHGIAAEKSEKVARKKRERPKAAPFSDSTRALSLRSVHISAGRSRVLGGLLFLGELGHRTLCREQQAGDARSGLQGDPDDLGRVQDPGLDQPEERA